MNEVSSSRTESSEDVQTDLFGNRLTDWEIPGAEGETIIGTAHEPVMIDPIGTVILCHGFLGYKDYGFFPYLAASLAAAGYIAHRFNFSHSGVTRNFQTFERKDLFERQTWRRCVEDVFLVADAVCHCAIPSATGPEKRPIYLWGHSRGGLTALLAAGLAFRTDTSCKPAAVISVSAPNYTCRYSDEERKNLQEKGYAEVQSGRTGEVLRVGRIWLDDQLAHPEDHDVENNVKQITCPVMIIHGSADGTVDPECALKLAAWRQGVPAVTQVMLVPGADHVFNTPNPFPTEKDQQASVSLQQMWSGMKVFLQNNRGR